MVAVAVHLGGAAFAFLYYRFNWRISPLLQGLWPNVQYWRKRAARPRSARLPRGAAAAGAGGRRAWPGVEEDRIKAEMDAVLEKISRASAGTT